MTQNYVYTANTNRLASITQGTSTIRSFVYDAAGHMTRDTRGTAQYNYTISSAGRIARVALGTSIRADYVYNGKSRLASRVTQNQTGAGTTRLFHDNDNRVIAEVNASGTTIREYIWLDDLPVAVLDGSVSQTNPTLFFVHADHLNRPVAMSNAAKSWVWRAQYEPFGAVHQIVGPAANDNRFPGQWFQLEAGLAYNWHRHYDATLGRYTQADPLGLTALLDNGPSVFGYAGQSPMMNTDETGEFFVPALIGAGIGAASDLTFQLIANRGNWNCVDGGQLLTAAIIGGIGGGAGSWLTRSREGANVFSHWIPDRYIRPMSKSGKNPNPEYKAWLDNPLGRSFVNSKLNGNHVSPRTHAMSDYHAAIKGVPKGDMWPTPFSQLARIPGWFGGSVVGSAIGVGNSAANGGRCGCQ